MTSPLAWPLKLLRARRAALPRCVTSHCKTVQNRAQRGWFNEGDYGQVIDKIMGKMRVFGVLVQKFLRRIFPLCYRGGLSLRRLGVKKSVSVRRAAPKEICKKFSGGEAPSEGGQ